MKPHGKFFLGTYTLTYAAIGALFPLVAQYLNGIGFSGTQIGIITASSTAIGIFSNSFWGGVYHRRQRSKKLITVLCITTALLSLLLMVIKSFWIFLIMYIAVFFFENPVYPLVDSAVMEVDYPFGKARKWGAVGFASGIGIAGVAADRTGLITIFPMYAALFLLAALLVWFYSESVGSVIGNSRVPDSSNHKWDRENADDYENGEHSSDNGCYGDLLKNKKYMALLLSAFFFTGPALSHNTYFSFLYIETGGTIAGMGVVLLLMTISETPFMAWSEKISSILTTERAILLAMLISAVRFFLYSMTPPHQVVAATFVLQGIANGIGLVEMVKYIAKLTGTKMVSLAIPLFTAVSSNCGTIICQLIGGIVVEHLGGWGVYLFYGIFNLVGILIYIIFGLHKAAGSADSHSAH